MAYLVTAHPEVSFGPDGVAYLVSSSAGVIDLPDELPLNVPTATAVFVNRSTDGGTTWSQPALIAGGSTPVIAVQDAHVTADPFRPGTAFATWTQFDSGPLTTSLHIARTTDGGMSWKSPETVPVVPLPGRLAMATQVRSLPNRSLVLIYTEMNLADAAFAVGVEPVRILALRSNDDGANWKGPVEIATLKPSESDVSDPETGNPFLNFHAQLPSIAVAPDGTLYVAWYRIESSTSSRIEVSTSSNGGASWSRPAAVSAGGRSFEQTQAFLPTIQIGPNRSLGVAFFDFRHDVVDDSRLDMTLWFRHSHDGGLTWHEDEMSGPFDTRHIPPWFGVTRVWYPALATHPAGFALAWIQPSDSPGTSGATDVLFARLAA